MMKPCQKIDAHAHAILNAQYEYTRYLSVTPENLFEIYDQIGVEKGVLMPILSPEGQFLVMPNGDTCALAKQYPERFFWFCNVDPRMGAGGLAREEQLSDMLDFYKGLGAKGVGEMTSNLYADDPLLDRLYSILEEQDMPLTIHIAPKIGGYYGIADEVGLPRIERMLKKHPKLKMLGHSQPFWAEISADCSDENRFAYPTGKIKEGSLARLLRECPNLYLDMSANSCYNALTRDTDYTFRFIEEFGDRMLYAIDYCAKTNVHTYKLAAFLDQAYQKGSISEKHYRGICRENAIRVMKLDI